MQKTLNLNFLKYVLSFFIFYILLSIILNPQFYLQTTLDGLTAWALNVLPSLLPFIFFTKLLSSLGVIDKISKLFAKPIKKIYKVQPIAAFSFFSSIISGYPVGAKITTDLYQSGKITRTDACKMLSFSSTSGPMFVIGAVGSGMFGSVLAGYLIFSAHVLGAILNGIIYRNIKLKEFKHYKNEKQEKKFDLAQTVLDTSFSVLSVGIIIAIFFVVIASLAPILSFLPSSISAFCGGLIEITKGCLDISTLTSLEIGIVSASFIISFGGISTLIQCAALTSPLKVPVMLLISQKLTHAILSCIISVIFVILFL